MFNVRVYLSLCGLVSPTDNDISSAGMLKLLQGLRQNVSVWSVFRAVLLPFECRTYARPDVV